MIVAVKYGTAGAVMAVLGHFLTTTAQEVAIVAAGCASAGYLTHRVFVPFCRLVKRALTSYKVLEHIPYTLKGIDMRLAGLERADTEHQKRQQDLISEVSTVSGQVEQISADLASLRQ